MMRQKVQIGFNEIDKKQYTELCYYAVLILEAKFLFVVIPPFVVVEFDWEH